MRLEPHFHFNQTEEKPPPQVITQTMDYKILLISLCIVHLNIHCKGRPLSKRTVSEMQLMHNLREHKQVQERREWLQLRLHGIHNAAARARSSSSSSGFMETQRTRKLRPGELTELSDLTSEEIQYALDLLEKLFESKRS